MKIKKMDRTHTETENQGEGMSAFEAMLNESLEKHDARPEKKEKYENEEVSEKRNLFKHAPGDTVSGKITRVEKFGAFVALGNGIEGLLHVSEIGWKRLDDPASVLKVGDSLKMKLLSVDDSNPKKLKISLSLKQLEGNPWDNLPEEFRVGNIVKGKVSRCMPFGAFVEFMPGVEGLIPLSQFTSQRRINQAEDVVSQGHEVAVVLKEINLENRRMSLSLKDAADADASATEQEDLRAFRAQQAKHESGEPEGLLAAKLKAALEKKI